MTRVLLDLTINNITLVEEDTISMDVGVNSNWAKDWDNPRYFVNLARSMGYWDGECIQRYGKLLPTYSTSIHTATLVDINGGAKAKPGIYVVSWEGEGTLSIGGVTSTKGSFRFDYNGVSNIGVTFSGVSLLALSVVHVTDMEQYREGNEWSTAYLDYFASLEVEAVRSMNWQQGSESLESAWEDRVTQSDISFSMGVPVEVILDFIERTETTLWYCIPPRATEDYLHNLGKALTYCSNLIPELGSEIWNYASPWKNNTAWIEYNHVLSETAKCNNEVHTFHLEDHGLQTNDSIVCFLSLKDKQNNTAVSWPISSGTVVTVEEVSKDSFRLYYKGRIVTTEEQKTLLFKRDIHPDLNRGYVEKLEKCWNILEKYVPRDNMHYTIASHYNNPWITSKRYEYLTDKTKLNSISIAPYYNTEDVIIQSFDTQATQERESFPGKIQEHKLEGVDLICYEGGPHYSQNLPKDVEEWLFSYWGSDECAGVISDYIRFLDDEGVSLFMYYKDASITRFGLTTDIHTAMEDGRYRGFIGDGYEEVF